MVSIHELWALANYFGFNPAELISDFGKKAVTEGATKIAGAAGEKFAGAAKAVVENWVKRFRASRRAADLSEQLVEAAEQDRLAILERGFEAWIRDQSSDAAEIARLLYRLVYLRALVSYCRELPTVGGAASSLALDAVWVPQTFKLASAVKSERKRGGVAHHVFGSLAEATLACGTPLILIGGTGSGKSTQVRKLIADRASEQLEIETYDHLIAQPLPVYVTAKALLATGADLTSGLARAVASTVGLRLPFPIPDGFFDARQPGSPKSLFLAIDGLDEIETERRDDFARQLDSIGRNHSMVVASRPAPCWCNFKQIEIQELSPEQAQFLVTRLATNKVARNSSSYKRLPRNPLLLTLAALLHQQDVSSHAVLYQEFILDRLKYVSRAGLVVSEVHVMFKLLEACAADSASLAFSAERLATNFGLLPSTLIGLERQSRARDLLLATGIIVRDNESLRFIHDSFRSYLRVEALAREARPDKAPWRLISPFREGWETISFIAEIWARDGQTIASALDDLFAFGEPGLRLLAQLAFRTSALPHKTIEAAVAKWMYRDDDFWDPGYIDGPVQQLTLIAEHYESARNALRTIASDSWTYSEDAAYAAEGLAKIGETKEAHRLLISQAKNEDIYCCHRVLALDLLIETGATEDAREYLECLASEWQKRPPDVEFAWMELAEALHKIGRKRKAAGILNRLSAELTDQLDLKFLSQTYLTIGKIRQAKAIAKRAFGTMERSFEALRGYDHDANEMAALLDRVGAEKEASFVRQHISRMTDQSIENLWKAALDTSKSAKHRLDAAQELFDRGEDVAFAAFEALLSDPGAPFYERFSVVPLLLDTSSRREQSIAALKRIAQDEPWHRIACGTALVLGGEAEIGCNILRRVAFEPAEAPDKRTKALEKLAQSGRLDLAAAAFRRLRHSGDLTDSCLKRVAEVFAHTPIWAEFLALCEGLLSSDNVSLRIEAVAILVRSPWLQANRQGAANLLRKIIQGRAASPNDRIDAARHLHDLEQEDAINLVFDITTAPEEELEAGLAAMQFLAHRDEFLVLDGGHDVVWDKKLSQDQFIEAANSFLSATKRGHSGYGKFAEGIREAVADALRKIAADTAQPMERRLAAAGFVGDASDRLHEPFWPAIRAICEDSATPLALRWPAIRYALTKDPSLLEQWKPHIKDVKLTDLQVAYILLAAEWRDGAAERFHAALRAESELRTRVLICKELAKLVESHFAGREAANLLEEALRSDSVDEIDSDLLTDVFLLARTALSPEALIDLATRVANDRRLSAYEIDPALEAITELAGAERAQSGIRKRIAVELRHLLSEIVAFYDLIHLCRLQAKFGGRADAAKGLLELSSNTNITIGQKVLACRVLAQLGRTADAKRRLRKLSARTMNDEDQVAIATAAMDIGDWSLARKMFLKVACSGTASLRDLVNAAGGLARVGLKGRAKDILRSIALLSADLFWNSSIEALIACGEKEHAAALCKAYIQRPEVDSLDKVEAIGRLGELHSKEIAREMMVGYLAANASDVSGSARGAELLYQIGFHAEARTLLLQLSSEPPDNADELLWLADSMVNCSLPFSAQALMANRDREGLGNDQQERLSYLEGQIASLILQIGNPDSAASA